MSQQNKTHKIILVLSLVSLLAALAAYLIGQIVVVGPFLALFFLLLAIGVRGYNALKGFSYTICIFAAVTLSLFYPTYFIQIGDFQMKALIVPLLQIIMFGMGTTMNLSDFAGVVKMPKAVIIGVLAQFTIMPLTGFTIANIFDFPPEIAAGIILIGSVPCGLASNVISYLAKANLPLSITLTSVATIMAPFVTPFLMRLLAQQYVEVHVMDMMWDIVKMVIIPIVIGLIFNKLLYQRFKWLDKVMPIVSMAGIALIISIITAAGRDSLLTIGISLIFAVLLHNLLGYLLGYWSGRLFKMDERSCRTLAIEVGMQNGGLASALALGMGKVATTGLAPAVFGPLMNITGSSLATWWRSKPIIGEEEASEVVEPVGKKVEAPRPH
jgi:bile acid:Na+ symporter, BASS family